MLKHIDDKDHASLPVDFQAFDLFTIDMGSAIESIAQQDGREMTDSEKKLYGVPLWQVTRKTVEKQFDEHAETVDDMRRKSKIERRARVERIAELVGNGMTVTEAIANMPKPRFVSWQDRE